MKRATRQFHRYLYLGSVLFFFLLHAPCLFYWATRPKKHYRKLVWARRRIGRLSAWSVGFRFHIHYEMPIDWNAGPYIICPNHTSNLDITAMVLTCGSEFSFIGKQELLDNPVTGLFFRSIDLPIDRKSRISAYRALKKAEELLQEGKSIVIFPEGTIHEQYPPRLGSFKNGPFRASMQTGAPVIPVVIQDAWTLFWDDGKKFGTRPGTVRVNVLRPVVPQGFDDADLLRDEVHRRIASAWEMPGKR